MFTFFESIYFFLDCEKWIRKLTIFDMSLSFVFMFLKVVWNDCMPLCCFLFFARIHVFLKLIKLKFIEYLAYKSKSKVFLLNLIKLNNHIYLFSKINFFKNKIYSWLFRFDFKNEFFKNLPILIIGNIIDLINYSEEENFLNFFKIQQFKKKF